jgi:hypothetical protein
LVFDGWIRSGRWMKGQVSIHDYLTGRAVVARVRSWLR